MYVYVYYAVYQKTTQHCKLSILRLKKKKTTFSK